MSFSYSPKPSKKSKHVNTTKNPNWLELPRDITSNILQRLGAVEILTKARNVCSYWWNICKDPFMWRQIHMGAFHLYLQGYTNRVFLAQIFRYAVDLSNGLLEKIEIFRFGNDDLLKYVGDRASQLKCILLESCDVISEEGLCEAAKKLPLLEEMYISYGFYSKKSIEVIGQSCPLLKSLTYYKCSSIGFMLDDDAFVIAKTMPKLRRLDIRESRISNAGLLAILDGCPLLEYLDIEGCNQIDFIESLWKRLNSQIKDLHIWDDDDDEDDEDEDDEDDEDSNFDFNF